MQAAQGHVREELPSQLGEQHVARGGRYTGGDRGGAHASMHAGIACMEGFATQGFSHAVQVNHFDDQQEAQARRAKYLHKVIGEQAATGAGSLTGKTQS